MGNLGAHLSRQEDLMWSLHRRHHLQQPLHRQSGTWGRGKTRLAHLPGISSLLHPVLWIRSLLHLGCLQCPRTGGRCSRTRQHGHAGVSDATSTVRHATTACRRPACAPWMYGRAEHRGQALNRRTHCLVLTLPRPSGPWPAGFTGRHQPRLARVSSQFQRTGDRCHRMRLHGRGGACGATSMRRHATAASVQPTSLRRTRARAEAGPTQTRACGGGGSQRLLMAGAPRRRTEGCYVAGWLKTMTRTE